MLSFTANSLDAQEPNWSLNPLNFQHSMTFTTFLNVNGQTLTSANDKVAAFVNDEVRGVANVTYIASRNKYVAFLTVFANTNSEELSFKIYASQSETIVKIGKTETFTIDGNLGGVFQSYSLANPELNNEAEVLDFSFKDVSEVSKTNTENTLNFLLPNTIDLTNLTPEFTLADGTRIFIDKEEQNSGGTNLNFTEAIIYTILSEDESVSKNYTINVSLQTNTTGLSATLSSNNLLNTNTNIVEVDVNFSEDIIDLFSDYFESVNAVIYEIVKVDNQNFKVKVIAIEEGVFSIKLKENTIQNSSGNQNIASNILNFTFDETQPLISNLELKEEVNQTFFAITFSEPVQNVDASDFEFVGTQSSIFTIQQLVQISSLEYQLKINKTEENLGSIFLKIKPNSDIVDNSNNTIILQETASFYLDNLAPVSDVILDATGECEVTVTEIPKAIDAVSGEVIGTTTNALSYNQQGEYTIIWSFDDGNGNISTANQKMIVKDEINPIARTKDIEVELDDSGNVSITSADIDDGSTDNCSIDFIEVSKTNFTTQDLGENTIVFKVVDKAGNKTEVNVKVTVVDKVLSTAIFELNENIYLYPNPSENSFKINLNIEKANVKIYDMLGKLVISYNNYISNESIDISKLQIGFFIVRISQNKRIISKRLTKFE
jgi:hypothetical protein